MTSPNVVVLVPGILGSELRHGDELVWPGTVKEYVHGYTRMAQLLDPATVPGDIIRRFGPLQQYGTLVNDLEECGFSEKASPPTLCVFAYDWRKDNAAAAARLADLLDAIVARHGGTAKIAIVAHSMGGLVSRSYLESGVYARRPGFAAVGQLITLATPHRGAALALAAAVGQISRLFLSKAQVQQLANHDAYPSLYQLMPVQGEPFAWNEDATADFGAIDVYESDTAQKLGLSHANLASAQAFHQGLSFSRRPTHVRYFSFYGTQLKTITNIGLLPWKDGFRVRQLEADHAGDQTVPLWSAAVDGIQGYPVGGEHGTIFRDDTLRRILGALLGKKGVLAAVPPKVSVLVPVRVVAPEAPLQVQLTFPTPTQAVSGAMHFRRIEVDDAGVASAPVPFGTPNAISYEGSAMERLDLLLTAPAIAGFYEAAYVPAGEKTPAASDQFIVQA